MKAVKQEIAKEGIYPYSIVFAESQDLSLSRIFGRKTKSKASVHHEKTPVATLVLHWVITNILIVAPVVAIQPKPYSSSAAYSYLTSAFIYDINVTYFIVIAVGLLCLRLTPSVRWAEKSPQRPWISVTAALILLIGCLFPFIFIWVPDPKFPKASNGLVSWWSGQTLAVCFLLFSFLYWILFRLYINIRSAREGKTLHIKREPIFKQERGQLVQVFEIVSLQWRRDVDLRLDQIEEADDDYRPSMIQSSSPPPTGEGRRSPYDGWQGRTSPAVGQSAPTVHEIGLPQPRDTVRRKPVFPELAA